MESLLSSLAPLRDIANLKNLIVSPELQKLVDDGNQWRAFLPAYAEIPNLAESLKIQPLMQSLQHIEQIRKAFHIEIPEKITQAELSTEINVALLEAVILGDEEKVNQFSFEEIKTVIVDFYVRFYPLLLTFLSFFIDTQIFKPSDKWLFCRKYQVENADCAEPREVHLPEGTLNVYQRDNAESDVIAVLPNGSQVCLPYIPKGSAKWIKVHALDDEQNIVVGYVEAKYTKRTYF